MVKFDHDVKRNRCARLCGFIRGFMTKPHPNCSLKAEEFRRETATNFQRFEPAETLALALPQTKIPRAC
jgi:hypothetical protein